MNNYLNQIDIQLEEVKNQLSNELFNDKRSLNKISNEVDISVNQLSLIKRGESKPSQLSTIDKLADYYDYDLYIEIKSDKVIDLNQYNDRVLYKFEKSKNSKDDLIYHNVRQIIEYIIEERLKRKLSQRDFSLEIDISQSNLALIENYSSNPNLIKLEKILNYFDTSMNIIFKKKG